METVSYLLAAACLGRTGAVLFITKNGVVRGKSWTRQTLSDAWESTDWEGLCGSPWQMVAPELKLTKKVTADKEGADTLEHGEVTQPHNDECRERIRTIIDRTLTGKARMNPYKDGIAETQRVKERQRARVERGAGDVLLQPGNRG